MEQHETVHGLIPLLKKMLRCAQERMLQFLEEKGGELKKNPTHEGSRSNFMRQWISVRRGIPSLLLSRCILGILHKERVLRHLWMNFKCISTRQLKREKTVSAIRGNKYWNCEEIQVILFLICQHTLPARKASPTPYYISRKREDLTSCCTNPCPITQARK